MSPSVGYPTTEYEESEPAPPTVVPDYGEGYRDLPDQLRRALLKCVSDAQAQEKFVRRQEVLQDAKIRFYDMGIQHVYLNGSYSWTMGTAGAAYSTGPNSKNYFSEYLDDYPILPAFGQIIRAKLSEHDPSVDFQPDDPNDPNDLESAKAAEAMRHDYDRNNDVKLLQQQIIYHWEMGGRCVVWTRSEDAPSRFGDVAGNPPRHVVSTAYGSIEAKVPIFAASVRDCGYCILYDDPDIQDAKEKYWWIKDKIDAGQQCLDENAYERIARLGIIQNSAGRSYGWNIGDAVTHLIGRGQIFLRTNRFQGFDDAFEEATELDVIVDGDNERVMTVGEKLKQLYPDGAHVTVVGQSYACSYNKSMDDCISISHPYIGKGQQRMPILFPMVVVQDRFNQGMNLIAESQDHLVPSTWIGCAATEFAAITKQRAKPGAFRNLKELPANVKIQDVIYREPDYQIPASAMGFLEFLDGSLPQFMLATPPAIWGQAMSENKTASGLQLAAAQAMGILGALWDMEVQQFTEIYRQNVVSVVTDEKYADKIVTRNRKGLRQIVEKGSLTKGKWRAYAGRDSGFPESTNAKRQSLERLIALIAPTPLGTQVMGSPDNIAELVRVSGVNLVIPEAEARDKQLREIEILLATEPKIGDPVILEMLRTGQKVPDIIMAIQQARNTMMQAYQATLQRQQVEHAGELIVAEANKTAPTPDPIPPPPPDPSMIAKSSVPIWPSDYHMWEAAKCQGFLTSDQCNTELTIGRPSPDPALNGEMVPNNAGVLNVFLHWSEHVAAIPLSPAPPLSTPLPAVGSPPRMAPQPAGS